jgi:hypothetical protein
MEIALFFACPPAARRGAQGWRISRMGALMLALILTAQILAAATVTPTATPVTKTETGQRTLAAVARERNLGGPHKTGGFSATGSTVAPFLPK